MNAKTDLPNSTGRTTEEYLTDTDTDIHLETTDTTESDTESDDTTLDPSQLGDENPFMPSPPPYELSNDPNATPHAADNTKSNGPPSQLQQQPQTQPQSRSELNSQKLEKLIAIPAVSHKQGSPFLRAYPACLESYQISPDVFLKFLDELNRATVKSPPFRVLDLAGMIIGYATIGTIPLVGQATQAIAKAGSAAVSKGRTELHMQEANRTIFGPHGLKCEIAKLNAVAKIANIPILDEKGRITKPNRLLSGVGPDDLEKSKSRDGQIIGQQRRLDALQGYIASLEVSGLPEMTIPDNAMSRWNAEASEGDRRRGEKKLAKQASKAGKKLPAEERVAKHYDKVMSKTQRNLDKVIAEEGADSKKAQKKMKQMDRKQAKLNSKYGKRLQKAEKKDGKETKEDKRMKKVLWVIVRDIDAKN